MSTDERFVELLPLLALTAAALVAAGLVVAAGSLHLLQVVPPARITTLLAAALGALAAGGAVGMLHLGRRHRALLAMAGAGSSWLSREVVAMGLLAASTTATLAAVALGAGARWTGPLAAAAAISGLLTALMIGKVYDLAGQAGWQGPAQWLTPPATTLLLAATMAAAMAGDGRPALLAGALLGLDAWLLGLRINRVRRLRRQGPPFVFAKPSHLLRELYAARVVLVAATATAMLLGWSAAPPWLVGVMIVLDRSCLYAGTARSTPAAEMAGARARRLRAAAGRSD